MVDDAIAMLAGGAVPVLDGVDLSAAGLGEQVRDAPWWDSARGGVRLAGRDLTGARLKGANLSGADLGDAVLSGASGSGVVLSGARLEEARLVGADLIGGVLVGVDAGEADFSDALLEDADLSHARLRFASFEGAVMDGANFAAADLWGARLQRAEAERACFKDARLDEAQLQRADLSQADLTGATLRRADLTGAVLRGAVLRGAVLDGADLTSANLTGAVLPHVSLAACTLTHIRVAGAWMERTRMQAHQLGGAIGEEIAGEFEAAREGYIVLGQNFRTLGAADDERWAFLRRRRMGKRLHAARAREAFGRQQLGIALTLALRWIGDEVAEWLCDYGESVNRVLRAFLCVLLGFAALYWATGCLVPREVAGEGAAAGMRFQVIDYLLFSLDSMTTVGTSDVGLRPGGQLGVLLSSLQTVLGTVLLGLFGFVLGVRMRN